MTVEFALFLSPEGIALAHRQQGGHWALVAEARPEGDDLGPAMAALRSAAELRGGSDAQVLLVLPDDQILYTSFMAPAHDADLVALRITEGLDGLTPYAVEDLVHDWCAVEEDRVKVAVVARETLDEARAFALSHGFTSAGFAAMPPAERFPTMPVFGDSAEALGLDRGGMAFGSDDWTPPEPVAEPEAAPEEEPEADGATGSTGDGETDAAAADRSDAKVVSAEGAGPQEAAPSSEDEASESVESAGDAAAAEPAGGADEAQPEAQTGALTKPSEPQAAEAVAAEPEVEPEVAPEAEPEVAAKPRDGASGADAAGDEPEAEVDQQADMAAPITPEVKDDLLDGDEDVSRAKAAEAADQAEPNPILDPTLERPVLPIAAEPELPLSGSAAAPLADASADEAEAETPTDPVKPARGKGASRSQPRLNAERPEGAQARPTGARRLSIPPEAGALTDPEAEIAPRTEEGTQTEAEAAGGPMPAFSARRGKVAKPGNGAGETLSSRPSRLGFGAAGPTPTPPVLHPDATVGPATPGPVRPGHRLAAQLARVRDASKLAMPLSGRERGESDPRATPKVEALAPEAGETHVAGEARVAAPAPAPVSKGAALAARGLKLGLPRRRAEREETETTPPGQVDGGAAFASGLLARKPVESAGPSFRTGLILTLVLLVLLALIAIWSALFLPDSPIARLLGGGDRDTVAVEEALPPPPLAVTAPPAMGALDTGGAAEEPVAAAESVPEAEVPVSVAEPVAAEDVAALSDEPDVAPEAEAVAPVAALPDIDADLDLPPLPPLPEDLLPTLEETERIYAEDGIWPRTPDRPTLAALSTSNEIYLASIDPEVPVTDAIALADPVLDPTEVLRRVPPPPPFGVTPDRDARGLVTPTPEGVLTPEGAFVISGRPAVDAIPRPREVVTDTAPALPQIDVDDAILRTVQPTPRPLDLEETRERQVLGGFSASELAALRPEGRPVSAQESAAQASLFPREVEAAVTEAVAAAIEGTELAVASSRPPRLRPENIAALVAAAEESVQSAPAVPQEAIARAPAIPSNADVTRAATERNAIRLRDINLIGVTGTPNDRRALVRLPSGRFVRVAVGDRLDGGRVAAIGENSLQYVLNGRNVTLEIPG
ncbi:hypothetical protein [Roseicyclus marinus]|uniref:Type IV pilus biogenesis protein PilP n=1 Tax=Roseicyclus marinus TaxID=2161673 RepID=A0AA48KL85_9RHOB|nr:hypothetical protein MACH21_20670 [Roseicyclus marinus]